MHQILGSLIKSGTFRPEAGIPRLRIPETSLQQFDMMSKQDIASAEGYDTISSLLPRKAEFVFPWGRIDLDGTSLKATPKVPGDYVVPIPACANGKSELFLFCLSVKCDSGSSNVALPTKDFSRGNTPYAPKQILNSLVKSETFCVEADVPRLRLPNASLRKPAPVVVDISAAKRYNEISCLLPEKSILQFSWGTIEQDGSSVTITPTEAGEYAIPIPACTNKSSELLVLQLTVNPDPNKLLQRELDPPKDAPYQKANNGEPISISVQDSQGHIIGASRRGQSHALDGTFRDDDLRVLALDGGVYLFAVADGAGSAKFARRGSELAVSTAIESMSKSIVEGCWDAVKGFSTEGTIGTALLDSALAALNAIRIEIRDKNKDGTVGNVTLHDYNTTLLLAAVKVGQDNGLQIASFAIGDGAIAWSGKNKFELLTNPDGGEYSGETYFLTTEKVWRQYNTDKIAIQKSRVKLLTVSSDEARGGTLMLMTDGVTDPFFPNPIDLTNNELWQKFITEEIRTAAGIARNAPATKELGEKLLQWINFRKKGHFDDRTLVLFELADGNSEPPPSNVVSVDSDNGNPQLQIESLSVSEPDEQMPEPKLVESSETAENNSQNANKEVANA